MYMYCEDVFEFDEEDPDIWLLHQVCLPPSFSSAVAISFFLSLSSLNTTRKILERGCFSRCVYVCLSLFHFLFLSVSVCGVIEYDAKEPEMWLLQQMCVCRCE